MIRFKTIEPEKAGNEKAAKPAAKPPAPVAVTPQEPASDDAETPKPKGLARKTPLRAKKPSATSGLFRD